MIAIFCLAMLGWSQFALASYSCPMDEPKMASLHAPQSAGGMQQKPGVLCKLHCDKSAPSQASHVPAPVFALLYTAARVEQPAPIEAFAQDRPCRLAGAFPPLRIRHQSFRN
ncbi:MAG: hypothetical protein HKL98_11620 [Burkholderiales bacterium]|nr:hypothetical protein [Burkholderiales bacterium]